ncbi:hypothetical protein [Microbacterium arborescens]|uniref:hypothetical protein n=1 Tax=Microbacterium arborescens TaxID=33883 RepID=UPI0025A18B84|nr:hypothetical protein [Microbacterium arborescens]WJM15293.1 hypothetical protein QUC20_13590 [Microbacterium arborescens]
MLTVFVRATPKSNGKPRPDWYSKEICIASVLDSAEQARANGRVVRCTLAVDTSSGLALPPGLASLTSRFDDVLEIDGGSSMRSWRALLPHVEHAARRSALRAAADVIYIVEDDHLHRPGALTELLSTEADYRYLYWTDDDRAFGSRRTADTTTPQWVPIESGVSSFGVTARAFMRDRWLHRVFSYGGGSWDELICRALGGGARRVYGSGLKYVAWPLTRRSPWGIRRLPWAAWHATFRAMSLIVASARKPATIVGSQPPQSTHAEPGLIARGSDWSQIANSVRSTE